MLTAHESVPMKSPWAYVGAILLAIVFFTALAAMMVDMAKHPDRYIQDRLGPMDMSPPTAPMKP